STPPRLTRRPRHPHSLPSMGRGTAMNVGSTTKRTRRHLARALHHRRRSGPGTAPGTLVADPEAQQPFIHVAAYDETGLDEADGVDVDTAIAWRGRRKVLWIDVSGLADLSVIEALGGAFGLHSLALEDTVNAHQRPKVEEFDETTFIVARMLTP